MAVCWKRNGHRATTQGVETRNWGAETGAPIGQTDSPQRRIAAAVIRGYRAWFFFGFVLTGKTRHSTITPSNEAGEDAQFSIFRQKIENELRKMDFWILQRGFKWIKGMGE